HRRLHCEIRQDLEKVILDYVADGARLIIKRSPPLDTEILRHRDLHTLDMVAIPERFQERIREARKKHVVYWSFSQIVIDAEDGLLIESTEQSLVELLRGGEIVTERLLDDDARAVRAMSFTQLFYDGAEQHRRDREIERRLLRRA